MRLTGDAFAIVTPRWFLGDLEFDMLEWHFTLLRQTIMLIAPYNPRNTNDMIDREYRVEKQTKEHSDKVRLWQRQRNETYSQRSPVDTTIGAFEDLGLVT